MSKDELLAGFIIATYKGVISKKDAVDIVSFVFKYKEFQSAVSNSDWRKVRDMARKGGGVMSLTPEQSKALAENIVANMEAWRTDKNAKLESSVEQHLKLMDDKAESMARRKAAMDETFHDSSYVNNRGYGEGRKMGD